MDKAIVCHEGSLLMGKVYLPSLVSRISSNNPMRTTPRQYWLCSACFYFGDMACMNAYTRIELNRIECVDDGQKIDK